MGYDIDYKSRIGVLNMLNSDKVYIRQSKIGHGNIIQCDFFSMHKGSWLRSMNRISLINAVEMGEESEISKRNT